MARQLEDYDFGASNSRYNWDQYFDGNIYELTMGEDFTAKPSSVVASARKAAGKANKTLKIRTDGEKVVLQAT